MYDTCGRRRGPIAEVARVGAHRRARSNASGTSPQPRQYNRRGLHLRPSPSRRPSDVAGAAHRSQRRPPPSAKDHQPTPQRVRDPGRSTRASVPPADSERPGRAGTHHIQQSAAASPAESPQTTSSPECVTGHMVNALGSCSSLNKDVVGRPIGMSISGQQTDRKRSER